MKLDECHRFCDNTANVQPLIDPDANFDQIPSLILNMPIWRRVTIYIFPTESKIQQTHKSLNAIGLASFNAGGSFNCAANTYMNRM